MEHQLRYAIFCADTGFRERVKTAVAAVAPGADLVVELSRPLATVETEELNSIRERDPRFFVLDVSEDPALGLRALRHLSEENAARVFLLTGPSLEPQQLLEAMRAGASEYLPQPVGDTDLAQAISRVIRRSFQLHIPETREPGRVFTVFGAKGGTGTTTAAVNLAVQLRTATDRPVLLVDLDFDRGSAAFLLGLKPRFSFIDVIRNFHRMDEGLLSSYVEAHETGLHLLAAPNRPDLSERVTREHLEAVFHFLRRYYDFVVVDLARPFAPAAAAVFQQAATNLLVTTPELPALHNIKRFLPTLDRTIRQDPRRAVKVVLNAMRADWPITADDVQRALAMDVYWTLWDDREALAHSATVAKPLVLSPRTRYAREVAALADDLIAGASGTTAPSAGRKALQTFMRSLKPRGNDAAPVANGRPREGKVAT